MAKVKFKVSVKEINFEYEGDFEQGRVIQQGISQTLGNIANLQQRAMGLPDTNGNGQPKMIESRPVEPPRRRSRRRRSSPTLPGDPPDSGATEGEAEGDGVNGSEEDGARRNTGTSPTALLIELRKGGFFTQQPRTMGEAKHELHRKGYSSIRGSDISGPLGMLARKEVLRRDKNQERNQWVYSDGPKQEP